MACKADVRKAIYDKVISELTEGRYTFSRVDDNTIQINGRVDNSKTKAQNRQQARAIAKEVVARTYKSFEGQVNGFVSEVSAYDPITVTFSATPAYVNWAYNNMPAENKNDAIETENQERDYINTDTGPNTYEQLRFFNSTPIAQSNVPGSTYTKYLQFKETQARQLKSRIAEIERKKKVKDITTAELTTLKNLERDLKTTLEGNFELGIKGIEEEIAELQNTANVKAVEYYAKKDLQRLDKLSKSNDLDDLNEAQKIIDFYNAAGTFRKDIENPFFPQEEIFLEDVNGNLTSQYKLADTIREEYEKWASLANGFQNIVDDKKKQLTVDIVNRDYTVQKTFNGKKFNFEDLISDAKGLKDADWLSMWTMDITQGIASHNGLLPQVMFSYLTNSFEKKLAWAREIEEKIDKMNPGVQKELVRLGHSLRGLGILGLGGASYNLFKEVTKEGNETGGIVQRYTKEYNDRQSRASAAFRSEFDLARLIADHTARNKAFNKAFEQLKAWRRNNAIIVDITKIPEIASEAEFAEFKSTGDPNYVSQLKTLLGDKGYTEEIDKQKTLLRKYQSERKSMIETALIHENKVVYADLSDTTKNGIKMWENSHSPLMGHEDYHSATGIFVGSGKVNTYMDYNHFIPRKYKTTITTNTKTNQYEFTDSTIPTGNYDANFATIEANPILSPFYDVIKEVTEVIRENMPPELQQKVAFNTLPGLMKTSAEIIADKNTNILTALLESFRQMWERLRVSFGVHKQSELSYAQPLDPITGKPNYRVNDGFLQGNAKAVRDRMTIEKAKFLVSYNAGVSKALKIDKIRRFSIVPLSRMSPDALVLLAQYLHVDISVDDIRLGKIAPIKNITGEQVEIGKYIRDFSLHSIVQSQSFDLGKIAKYFSNMTMTYAARQEALPILEIMKKHYERIKKPHTNNVNEQLYNVPYDKYMQIGLRTNAIRQMDDWFERVALDNYGAKHSLIFGSKKEKAIVGENIYTVEERKKLDEINTLLANPDIEAAEKDKLQDIKDSLGKTRTGTALIDNLLSWIRTLRLGYNISSASTNFLEGFTSNMIVGASDQYFDPNEIFYGYHVIKQSFLKNLTFGKAETALAKKNRSLMDKFNVIMDSKNELQKSSTKTISSRLSWLSPHELNQRVEYINQSPVMIAMLRTLKVKDKNGNESKLWDAYNKEGHLKDEFKTPENIKNWEDLSGDEYLAFKQKLNKVIVLAHGNYDQLRGMMAKSGSGGKAMMMFKTWLPNAIYQRFAVEQDDIQAGTIGYKGKYFSYTPTTAVLHVGIVGLAAFGPIGALAGLGAGGIMAITKLGVRSNVGFLRETVEATMTLVKKMIGMPVNAIVGRKVMGIGTNAFDSWVGKGSFTQQDANNLKSNMADISIQLAWLALILITKSLFWDDDDKTDDPERIAHNILVNRLMQLSSQAAMYINPVDMYQSTLGSIAVVKYMEDLGKLGIALEKWSQGDGVIPTGVNAGESRVGNASAKVFLPGMFRDAFGARMLGFDTQADKVFEESPFHKYFRSSAYLDAQHNKQDRAERRNELEKEYTLDQFDGESVEEKEKAKKKQITKDLDEVFPTPNKLKKLGVTREEYQVDHPVK